MLIPILLLQLTKPEFFVSKVDISIDNESYLITHSRAKFAVLINGSQVSKFDDSAEPVPYELRQRSGASMNANGVISVYGALVENRQPSFSRQVRAGSGGPTMIDEFICGTNGFFDVRQNESFAFDKFRVQFWAPNLLDGRSALSCLALKEKKWWIGSVGADLTHQTQWFQLPDKPLRNGPFSDFTCIAGGFLFTVANAIETSLWYLRSGGTPIRVMTVKGGKEGRQDGESTGSTLSAYRDGKRFLWIANESIYYGSITK